MKNTTVNKNGTLTLANLEEMYDSVSKIEFKPSVVIVPPKFLEQLKKRYPKKYAKWLKEQNKPYVCSWQRMGEELGIDIIDNK